MVNVHTSVVIVGGSILDLGALVNLDMKTWYLALCEASEGKAVRHDVGKISF